MSPEPNPLLLESRVSPQPLTLLLDPLLPLLTWRHPLLSRRPLMPPLLLPVRRLLPRSRSFGCPGAARYHGDASSRRSSPRGCSGSSSPRSGPCWHGSDQTG